MEKIVDEGAVRRTEPAAAQAYRLLEGLIVTLRLAPGSTTTEGEIIDRVGLGRTPVREAIQRLAWEGLIEIRPRAGLVIAPLALGDWRKVIDAREGVEGVLARAAARNVDQDAARLFHDAALAMQRSAIADDVEEFLVADKALDEALAAAAANPFAARLAAPLQTHSRRFWFRHRSADGLAESARLHVAVIHAVLERDVAAASRETARLMDMLRRRAMALADG